MRALSYSGMYLSHLFQENGATGSDVGKANCISSAGGNQTFGPYYCTLSLLVARSRAEEERVGVGGSPLYSARRGNIFQQPTCL